jgi:hypothetical protein
MCTYLVLHFFGAHYILLWTQKYSLLTLIVLHFVSLGSLTSCDSFLNAFQSKGLRPEVICPCASSSEAQTVSIRRYVVAVCLLTVTFTGKLNNGFPIIGQLQTIVTFTMTELFHYVIYNQLTVTSTNLTTVRTFSYLVVKIKITISKAIYSTS